MSKATAEKLWTATRKLEKATTKLTELRTEIEYLVGEINDIAMDTADDNPPIS